MEGSATRAMGHADLALDLLARLLRVDDPVAAQHKKSFPPRFKALSTLHQEACANARTPHHTTPQAHQGNANHQATSSDVSQGGEVGAARPHTATLHHSCVTLLRQRSTGHGLSVNKAGVVGRLERGQTHHFDSGESDRDFCVFEPSQSLVDSQRCTVARGRSLGTLQLLAEDTSIYKHCGYFTRTSRVANHIHTHTDTHGHKYDTTGSAKPTHSPSRWAHPPWVAATPWQSLRSAAPPPPRSGSAAQRQSQGSH